ncbi:cytochrome c family protein [Pseudomonas sp. M47T1]|uniref:cytochrome c n=1 Tax=Pseudomonas sp. M47T1 TaxID=1179778 RepID=UPI0002607B07|nr:cytochrome c [Pseudomonas sp. M47T1]EIK97168.1 cytochrome c family protein [Pseudomonas sp. M47T1]
MTFIKVALAATLAMLGASAQAADAQLIAKGEYLTRAADCEACHTTPGGKPFTGGLAFQLPFGTLYSPNITPDTATGIGSWSDDDFVSALQKGVGKDGKHYYPAFPYTSYTLMPREDILAIKAYLFSMAPVSQPPKDNTIGFPFNQRWGMAFWNRVFAGDKRFVPDPQQSAEWNRGAYLVEGPGHCGECHSPRNLFQAVDSSKSLAGAAIGNWQAYNISSDKSHGVGGWPRDVLARYLATGQAPGYAMAGGPMSDVVEHSLRFLTPADIQAVAVYLQASPARSEGIIRPPVAVNDGPLAPGDGLGRKVFVDACAGCHRLDGQGNQTSVATLTGLKTLNDPSGTNMIAVLLAGHYPYTFGPQQKMPDFAQSYSNKELAAVSTFVLRRFGATDARITEQQVARSRASALH